MGLLVGLVFGAEPGFTERIYRWVAIAGLLYAAFSIFSEITNPTMLLWREKIAYVDAITGTFVNHNTAAVFFGAVAIIWYLLALRELRRTVDLSRWREPTYIFNKLKNQECVSVGLRSGMLLCNCNNLHDAIARWIAADHCYDWLGHGVIFHSRAW